MGIRLSTFRFYFYALDSYRVTFVPYLIQCFHICPEAFTLTDLDLPLWIRVRGRLTRVSDQSDQRSDQRDMDSQIVTVDQFSTAMASIQEAIANLGQRIDGQQTQQVPVQESAQFDTIVPPPSLPSQSVPQTVPFTLHSQIEVASPPVTSPIPTSEDPHTRMDRLE